MFIKDSSFLKTQWFHIFLNTHYKNIFIENTYTVYTAISQHISPLTLHNKPY